MSRDGETSSGGFGLIEVIVAMFILALVIIGILPILFRGLELSAEQSSVATATRFLNSLVEQARDSEGCDALSALVARTEDDGRGATLTASGTCDDGSVDTLTLSVLRDGAVLVSTTALVYAP